MSSNRFWPLKLALWLIAIFFLLILFVLPLLTAILINSGKLPSRFANHLMQIEQLQSWSMQLFTIVWIFFVGSCFASFLNVVAWRVPRGRSILGSSKCPYCNVDLTFRNNIPIVGWLRNRGRCQKCRLPISPRYLIAEIILGTVFLLLAIVELYCGGWNIPFRPIDARAGFDNTLFDPNWDLIRLLLYHLVLMSGLFTFALITSEKFPVPLNVFLFALLIGIVLPIIWPSLQPVAWDAGLASGFFGYASPIVTVGINSVFGGISGWLFAQLLFFLRFARHGENAVAGLVLVGFFLGWQSTISVVVLLIAVSMMSVFVNRLRSKNADLPLATSSFWNPSTQLALAVLVHLLSWRLQYSLF